MLLWTTDRASYGRLARLITRGRRQASKGEFHLTLDELAEHAEGLLCGVLPGETLESPLEKTLASRLAIFREIFGDRGYLVAEVAHGPDDTAMLARLEQLSRRTRLPLVAAGDVHYHARAGWLCKMC